MGKARSCQKKLHPYFANFFDDSQRKEMSKNTSSSAFRKIDVDQFDEANFKDDEGPAQDSGFAGVSESEIANLLQQGKADEALKVLLASAPVGSKNQADKDAAFQLVLRVLLSVKQNQVEKIVGQLDNDQKDLLMKYIYRGFETPPTIVLRIYTSGTKKSLIKPIWDALCA